MKVYVKCKINPNSGLLIGHSENFTKQSMDLVN